MSTVSITHKLTDPSGTAVVGMFVAVRLNRPGFRTSDGSEIIGPESVASNGTGDVTLVLERNADISPANTWYIATEEVSENLGGRKVYAFKATVNQSLNASRFDPSA
jgi:hypothetical protein